MKQMKPCARCGKEVSDKPSRVAKLKYCSQRCHLGTLEDVRVSRTELTRRWRSANPQRYRAYNRSPMILERRQVVRAAVKLEALAHYGKDGVAECVYCGFGDPDALTFDHVNNNGRQERAVKRRAGYSLAAWLKHAGWPRGYQTLCANCNLIKEVIRRRSETLRLRAEKQLHGLPE